MNQTTQPCKMTLALQINQVKTQLSKQLDKALSAHGIGVSEFLVLHALISRDGKLSRVVLADLLCLTASAITKLLAPMEKIGLIAKAQDDKDARISLVVITQAGRTIYGDASGTVKAELDYHFARLSDEEVATLSALLSKI